MPTIVHVGAIETLYDVRVSYAEYFIMQAPFNIVRAAALILIVLAIYRIETPAARPAFAPEPTTPAQARLFALMLTAIGFWATDVWHGVAAGLGGARGGGRGRDAASGLLRSGAMKDSVDLSPALYLAGIFAVSATARHAGLDAALGEALIERPASAKAAPSSMGRGSSACRSASRS